MTKFLSVEEAHIKTGQTCKLCNHQIAMVKDESLPAGFFKQPLQAGLPSYVISKRIKYHESGLCYFHLKKKQQLYNSDPIYEAIKQEQCAKLKMIPLPVKRWRQTMFWLGLILGINLGIVLFVLWQYYINAPDNIKWEE